MKFQFTHKAYQTAAVQSVVDCFAGQPKQDGITYRLDPGKQEKRGQTEMDYQDNAFRNAELVLPTEALLKNIQGIQRVQNLTMSKSLVKTINADLNLDVEMETGTGKTYVYIQTMFELNRRYGWSKFIIVVPSIAIREGIQKSLEITAEHFLQDYNQKARFFTYNSKQLHNLESYSSDAGLNVMIINTQAFAATGKDQRRIYEELDDFQSRRPIDVIQGNRPILILDEPQRMEGKKTQESLRKFNPLFVLRYSATHKTTHNLVHRLDALDAYNQKLVKKIAVHGIAQKGLTGTDSYLYLEGITISRSAPVARLELEIQSRAGNIKRTLRKISQGANLFELSGDLGQYEGYVVSEIDAVHDRITFTNGQVLRVGQVHGDLNETALRRIQIREAIRAHLEKERALHEHGIKVLTLFFIDEVAKYRIYNEEGEEERGEYATAFEEEYVALLDEYRELGEEGYQNYLKSIEATATHNGYFAIDKKGRLVDPKVKARGEDAGLADDLSAYDLILKDKERLLSFAEPTRFLFSHSALREGWDNPNVFVICTLKHSDNTILRRQEVGRGMRLCVNQEGERLDDPATAHEINRLTVVANESYEDFVKGLQGEIRDSLSSRPRKATVSFFEGKLLTDPAGTPTTIDTPLATKIHRYLIKHDYIDDGDQITDDYHEAKANGALATLPAELAPYTDSLVALIDSIFSEAALPQIDDGRTAKVNPLNENFHKKEFQDLWKKINHRAAYTVAFDSEELIGKAIAELNAHLRVNRLQFHLKQGEQKDQIDEEGLAAGESFVIRSQTTQYGGQSVHSTVSYDLIGEIAEKTQLTRRTTGAILKGLHRAIFLQFRENPEDFITKASRLIKEQKATAIIEHLAYDPIGAHYDSTIFASPQQTNFHRAYKADNHIYDYVFTDSNGERKFVEELDTSAEVTVYAKLPRGFSIPTPVGDYNPDWAIAFENGKVKHLYFIAETKGSMSTLEFRKIEEAKISCAKKFFAKITDEEVRYEVVENYETLINLLQG